MTIHVVAGYVISEWPWGNGHSATDPGWAACGLWNLSTQYWCKLPASGWHVCHSYKMAVHTGMLSCKAVHTGMLSCIAVHTAMLPCITVHMLACIVVVYYGCPSTILLNVYCYIHCSVCTASFHSYQHCDFYDECRKFLLTFARTTNPWRTQTCHCLVQWHCWNMQHLNWQKHPSTTSWPRNS